MVLSQLGRSRRENAESRLNVIARSAATKQSSFLFCDATMDCFASLAMTV
jgi:hypothetical protein